MAPRSVICLVFSLGTGVSLRDQPGPKDHDFKNGLEDRYDPTSLCIHRLRFRFINDHVGDYLWRGDIVGGWLVFGATDDLGPRVDQKLDRGAPLRSGRGAGRAADRRAAGGACFTNWPMNAIISTIDKPWEPNDSQRRAVPHGLLQETACDGR